MEHQQDGNSNISDIQEKLIDALAKLKESKLIERQLRIEKIALLTKLGDLRHQLLVCKVAINVYETNVKLSPDKLSTKAPDLIHLIKNDFLSIGHRKKMATERTTSNALVTSTLVTAIEHGKLIFSF